MEAFGWLKWEACQNVFQACSGSLQYHLDERFSTWISEKKIKKEAWER